MTIIVDLSGGGTGGSAYWDRDTTGDPFLKTHNAGDDVVIDGNLDVGATDEAGIIEVRNASGTTKVKLDAVNGNSFGDDTPTAIVDIVGDLVLRPSTPYTIVAGTGITQAMILANPIVKVVGNTGDITITATPSIVGGKDGQLIILRGTDNTDTVTFQDETHLAGTDLNLDGGADMTLGKGDILGVICDTTDGKYYEAFRSNNTYTA